MKKLLPFLIILFALNTFSQKEANFWFFGNNAGLDFSTNPPTVISGALTTDEGSASISDADGNLLFYTDGTTVYKRNGQEMINGNNLFGNSSSSQSAIIVPKPLSTNIYYIFTVGNEIGGGGNGVFYSEVNMDLDNGFGNIIQSNKNIELNGSRNAREKITSVVGDECNTFWVITADSQNFYSYKINDSGVNTTPESPPSSHAIFSTLRGYLKLSPDGKFLVSASQNGETFIYDFNNVNGEITNERTLNADNDAYGVEFSRDSKKLYISRGTHSQNGAGGARNPPSFANIYQFDLDTNNDNITDNIADINNSRTQIYFTNSGYRGALQLASNGKIYYARSRQNFLGVINSPEKDAADVNFDHEGVDLGANISTEGLPPFIQSFFLPISINDTDTGELINDQNLKFCTGDNKLLSPNTDDIINPTNENYIWTFDNGTTVTEISNSSTIKDLELTNISTDDAGTYNLKITLKDKCDKLTEYNGTFNIEVFDAAVATEPADIIFCDTDTTTDNDFNLSVLKNTEILNGLDASIRNNFDVLYFNSMQAAIDNVTGTDLSNPYKANSIGSQTIYARVHNKNSPETCFDTTNFELVITGLPLPKQPEPYRICDDLESGSDTDKTINTFLLNTKDDEIYGTLDKTQYTITYHTTQIGADTDNATAVIDKNTIHSVTDSQTVYIRVENKDNTDCYDASKTLELIVDPLPILKPNPELNQCIEVVDINTTVNLTLAEQNISETANVTFGYYEDMAGTNQITDPTSYPVQANIPKTVYVKVISEFNCARDLVDLIINVGQTVRNPYQDLQPPVCDDFLDADGNDTAANSDTDNITNFTLDKTAIINGINPPANTIVSFYENEMDRDNSLNEIDITNFRNDITKNDVTTIPNGIQFPIFYKILSTINNDCQGLGEFYLQIDAVPTANTVPDLELCDNAIDGDRTNGIVQSFDLESQTTSILNGQNPADFSVTYHLSEADANAGNNAQASPFANTVRDLQPIHVRVTNNTTGCFTDHTSFDLIINPLPIANFVDDLEICDDNSDGSARNGFSQSIDLESKTAGILGTQDPSIYAVTYHRSLADAQNGNQTLVSPYSNIQVDRETIFVRVYNSATMCANGISNFDVIVNPEPIFDVPTNLSYCDDALDGDDANGIIQNIDLDSKISEILGTTQNPSDFTVTFHSSQADATAGNLAIASPYENSNPTETFFVRIQNKRTLCVNDDATLEVTVNSLPDFVVTTPQILCLNDITINGSPAVISAESPRDIYTYEWRNANGDLLETTQNFSVTTPGTYTVTATTNNGTLCKRTETIVVNPSSNATLERNFITIVDEGNVINSENNLSISIDVINNDLGPGDYRFAIINTTEDDTRTPMIGFQEEPLFENLEGGVYQVIVNDKNGCSPDAKLLVSVIQFPKFFTPNADGKNDSYVVKGVTKDFYADASINIFNRYGKLVAQEQIDSQGWNGMYNGRLLPSDDYWFNITLIPTDTTKPIINKKGNFSLLRRE